MDRDNATSAPRKNIALYSCPMKLILKKSYMKKSFK
jgi:hypothetical protein